MATALSELERDPGILGYDHWTGTVLGGLLLGPDLRLDDSNPDATLTRARENWPAPDVFADLVSRWLPLTRGTPEPQTDWYGLRAAAHPSGRPPRGSPGPKT